VGSAGARYRRNRAARKRIAERRPHGCPRPDKRAYDLSDPVEDRIAQRRGSVDMNLYRCRCSFYHWGHALDALTVVPPDAPEPGSPEATTEDTAPNHDQYTPPTDTEESTR
jgi:hypothetical protein